MFNAMIEAVEPRRLFATTHIYDPSVGMSDGPIETAIDYGFVKLPQVSADGTITVEGTGLDDTITVDRVRNPADDLNDNDFNFASYKAADGSPVWSSGELEQYADGTFLADERAERDNLQAQLDEAASKGYPTARYQEQIDGYNGRIDAGQKFMDKFTGGKFLRITLAGVYDYFLEMTDEQAANAKIVIDGGAGRDRVTIANNVPLKASVYGGSGSDTLTSGRRKAVLMGGGGNDKLVSRSVKGGALEGGKGADTYYNYAGAIGLNTRADGDRVATAAGLVPASGASTQLAAAASFTKRDPLVADVVG